MTNFIELKVSDEEESKMMIVNLDSIGRIYVNPQSNMKSIVELNYQSINDAPVYLEIDMPYDKLKLLFLKDEKTDR
jgi:hypothetical protein